MFHLLRAEPDTAFEYGAFRIRRMRPGHILPGRDDPSLGPLSIIDHSNLQTGTLVSMHQHQNDEILSYLWQGSMVHEDQQGNRIPLSAKKLMMMNAGEGSWHEESTPIVPAELLQIFIRPCAANLPPRVQFMDRPQGVITGEWTLLAGPEGENAPLDIRQQVFIYDIRLEHKDKVAIPSRPGFAQYLYVMEGEIDMTGPPLYKGDAACSEEGELPAAESTGTSTLVCFLVRLDAVAVTDGLISGS